ncbi:MAG: 23S rRNA (guanosine(2251)-2'-O)-methyltransferase RlmB [Candidatus Omnitrophota bacterium]
MAKGTMALYGKNSIYERLRANPKSIKNVFMTDHFSHEQIESLIHKYHIPAKRLSAKEHAKLRPAKDLQGIVAEVDKFQYYDFQNILDSQHARMPIFLDRINDPQNLGVMVRIAACFGSFAIVIPEHESCEVNETVLHVACGGENFVKICMVTNLSKAIIEAKKSGFWIVGADVNEDAQDIQEVSLNFPLGLVMGSEGEGIRPGIQKHLDFRVRIPMQGASLSFNVSMACAIFCYEISRQKGKAL